MARSKTHAPLDVLINGRLAGRLTRAASGAVEFRYDSTWLDWGHRFAISLSLPLREGPYHGARVTAVFDNLLPDSPDIRRGVAERTGAGGTDAYSLLEQVGRDCVGAMQFLHAGQQAGSGHAITGRPVSDGDIEKILAGLARVPLGIDPEHEFRISVAGAQEKTALLFHEGQWIQPSGSTATTHILKPEIGTIPTSTGVIDMSASVDNEHYCLTLLAEFGLTVATTQIVTFGRRRVLVVERFDRAWQADGRLLRLPQEDMCQALGVPPTRKYQSTVEGHLNGPSFTDIAKLLEASDTPVEDREAFLASQIVFWLIGATDGHAKNFSIFLRPGGGFRLTPFYDVLSTQPAFDRGEIPRNRYRLAMSAGRSRKYVIGDISGHHFVESGREAGLGPTIIGRVIRRLLDEVAAAPGRALARMPEDFAREIHDSVSAALIARAPLLEAGLAAL